MDSVKSMGVATIAAFTAKRTMSVDSVGISRESASTFSPVEFSNLILTMNDSQAADWRSWTDDFLVNGNHLDGNEKTGTLNLLDASFQSVIGLQFSHLGIIRLSRLPTVDSNSTGRLEAELYYESLSITAPVAAAANDASGAAPPPAADAAATPASATNAGVQTGPDLRDFPHVDGLTKRSYTSSQRESAAQENADYSSSLDPDNVAAKYESALKAAGWQESSRDDSGDTSTFTRFVRRQWKRLSQSADIRITQTKAKGSEIYVATDAARAGILSATAAAMKQINPDLAPATGSPNDQGARDPANFPRIVSSVRRAYAASGTAAAPHEDASYRTKLPIAQVEAFYVNRLLQSDWEQSERRETADADSGSHQITLFMHLGLRTVTIDLKEIQPELTEITVMSATSAP